MRNLTHLLAQVYAHRAVNYGDQQDQAWSLCADAAAKAEHDQPLVFVDDSDGVGHKDDQYHNDKCNNA